jgi:hypothetical protein
MKNMKSLRTFAFAFGVCALAAVASCDKEDDNTGNGDDTATLAAPTNLRVSAFDDTTATFAWDASSSATAYAFKISAVPYIIPVAGTSYTATGLTIATSYTWSVRAESDKAHSEWANSTVTTFVPDAIAAPTGLTATPDESGATLSWTASTGASSYELKVGESLSYTLTATSHTVASLTNAASYTWSVRAMGAKTHSEWASDTFTTTSYEPAPELPVMPTVPSQKGATVTFKVTYAKPGTPYAAYADVDITWNAVSYLSTSGEHSFNLELYPFDYATVSAPLSDYDNCSWGTDCYNNTNALLVPQVMIGTSSTVAGTYNDVSTYQYKFVYDPDYTMNGGTINYNWQYSRIVEITESANDKVSGKATGILMITGGSDFNTPVMWATLTVAFKDLSLNTSYQYVALP